MINYKKQFIFIVGMILLLGFFITSFTSYFVSKNLLETKIKKSELPLTSDNIYSEIERDLLKPVFISSLMASNTFLKDWIVNGENNEKDIIKYLNKIKNKYKILTSFYVSEKTRKYYQSNLMLKKISEDNIRDKWYFRVKNIKEDYEINVDLDMANKDTITIFVNHKVFDYNNKFIGITGIGLSIDSVKELVNKYQEKYNRDVLFMDFKGDIILSNKDSNLKENIKNLKGISQYSKMILSSKVFSASFENNGITTHLNTRFIPELNWYLLVEESDEGFARKIFKTLIINLVISVLVTFIIILLLNFTLNAYRKKLNHLLELTNFLPICSSCKNIRDDKGYWSKIETYIQKNSETEFSHSICPTCAKKLYPDIYEEGDETTYS